MRAKVARFAVALALGGLATGSARAQFGPVPFPLIVVPPPPAQAIVTPRPRPEPKPTPKAQGSSPPREIQCHYQGMTRVCE